MEGPDRQFKPAYRPPKYASTGYRAQPPVPYPSAHNAYHENSYDAYFRTNTRPAHSRLQTVVTNSFSIEDDREDSGERISRHVRRPAPDQERYRSYPPHRERTEQRELHHGARERDFGDRDAPPKPIRVPISPPEELAAPRPQTASLLTTPRSKTIADNLKRNFWHHSRPTDTEANQIVHPAFLPPKRSRTSYSQKQQDTVLMPRSQEEIECSTAEMTRRDQAWPASGEEQQHTGLQPQTYRKTQSFPPPPTWQQLGSRQASNSFGYRELQIRQDYSMDDLTAQRSWSRDETFHQDPRVSQHNSAFRSIPNNRGGPHNHYLNHQGSFPPPVSQLWHGGSFDSTWSQMNAEYGRPQQRDEYDSSRDPLRSRTFSRDASWDAREADLRHVTFDRHGEMDHSRSYHNSRNLMLTRHPVTPGTDDLYRVKSRSMSVDEKTQDAKLLNKGPILYLSQLEDRISLSETLCTIRENVEVFIANKADVEAPAPGRKHPVAVGQVGLRCIHCRHTTKSSDRVKRAVCYPSSIRRIYRTVIDMKLDHFQHCRFVPQGLKDRLDELKAINTRSTGTTMQYFVKAAKKMGMIDASSGVRMEKLSGDASRETPSPVSESAPKIYETLELKVAGPTEGLASVASDNTGKSLIRTPSESSDASVSITSSPSDISMCEEIAGFEGKLVLALPEDKMALSPLRCFLRENVYAFSATEEDIAVRTPTTFSVSVGQVGIGCIHCNFLPAKERSNRAVCFPFSIGRIYQSVADIQRFHFSECKNVPEVMREKFQLLQSASSKGSKGLATRQYWVSSAKKVGLVDTPKGIRFNRDPSIPATPAISLDILAQVASNVTTVNRPLVLPEDKICIADFLFSVMAQLQACRFTEADRNKRRLKDVGCIGVECKHCAGQVESRKFFWSSVSAVESNFVSVHTHMMECKHAPDELKTHLSNLKQMRKEQTSRLKNGSQKAFFHRVWNRLHEAEQDHDDEKEGEVNSNDSQQACNVSAHDEIASNHVDEITPENSGIEESDLVSV